MEELLAELEPEWGGAMIGEGYVQLTADGLAAGSG